MTYEELSKNTLSSVKRVSEFLECTYNDEELHQLIEHILFERMREKIIFKPTNKPEFK